MTKRLAFLIALFYISFIIIAFTISWKIQPSVSCFLEYRWMNALIRISNDDGFLFVFFTVERQWKIDEQTSVDNDPRMHDRQEKQKHNHCRLTLSLCEWCSYYMQWASIFFLLDDNQIPSIVATLFRLMIFIYETKCGDALKRRYDRQFTVVTMFNGNNCNWWCGKSLIYFINHLSIFQLN